MTTNTNLQKMSLDAGAHMVLSAGGGGAEFEVTPLLHVYINFLLH